MKRKPIQPTEHKVIRFDWAMKTLLRNKANFDILEGFLSELLKENVKIESLLENESNQYGAESKFNRVDLLVNTSKKEKIIIEVQAVTEWDFFHRILFGTSKIVTEYIQTGQEYIHVPKVISVSILFFDFGVGSDYIYKGSNEFYGVHKNDKLGLNKQTIQMYLNEYENKIEQISNIFPTYYLIQLKKFTNIVKDKFDQWVYMLKNEAIRSDFDAKGIKSAFEKLDVLKMKDSAKKEYDKFWADVSLEKSLIASHKAGLMIAKQEGLAEGLAEGRAEGETRKALEMARKMKAKKRPISEIMEYTGLTKKELEKV